MRFFAVFVVLVCVGCTGDGGGGGGRDPIVPDADPRFGSGGLASVNFGGGLSGLIAVARQDDGKIVGFGGSRESIALVRTHSDGRFDTGFGDDGVVQLPWGVPTNGVDKSHGIAIQDDGKILVTTRILGVYGQLASQPIVARFTSDGELDTSFAATGYMLSELNRDLRSVAVQPDGKIVVGGSGRLERLNADGTRDTSFGTDGVATTTVLAQDLVLQPDGKMVTAGGRDIARFTAAGALDPTFAAPAGMVTMADTGDILYSVALASDGKILAGGSLLVSGATDPRFAVTRYDTDGVIDAGFGSSGFAHDGNTAAGGTALVGMGIAPDGKIVGVGYANVGGTSAGRSARFDANGIIDTSSGGAGAGALLDMVAFADPVFEPDGAVTSAGAWFGIGSFQTVVGRTSATGAADSAFGASGTGTVGREIGGSFDRANHLALQSDGSVIVSGWAADAGGVGVIRLDEDGDQDTAFGTAGIVTGIFDSDLAYVNASIVQADDRIVFTGPTYQGGFSIVRLDGAGVLDAAFGTEGVVRAEPIPGMRAVSRAIAEGADGSIFVAGETANLAGTSEYAVTKFSADGARDMAFGGGGAALSDFGSGVNIATHLVLQPDGKPVTLGLTTGITLVRFDGGGAIDSTFGTAGRATLPLSLEARDPFNLLQQPDGKLVAIAGNFLTGALVVARFGADGQKDTGFGVDGVATFQLAGGTDYYYLQAPMGAAVLPDGKIVVGLAESDGDHLVQSAVLVRTLPDGTPDESFGVGGIRTLALGRGSSALHAITLQPDGKLLLGGRVWTETGGSDFSVLRLIP